MKLVKEYLVSCHLRSRHVLYIKEMEVYQAARLVSILPGRPFVIPCRPERVVVHSEAYCLLGKAGALCILMNGSWDRFSFLV